MKKKILIVIASYYKEISSGLLKNTLKQFPKNNDIKIINVWCIWNSCNNFKKSKKFDAFIALGCVIKGKTPHFDFISQASTNAIMKLSIDSKKPIGNGIITCLNINQAKARKSKGAEAAKAVISVLSQKWEFLLVPIIIQE